MQGNAIISELEQGKKQGKEFIKWWRRENDFVDFELIDRYLKRDKHSEIENFELLDTEEMWEVLKAWKASGLSRIKSSQGETIEWKYAGKDGELRTYTCPFNAHNLMSIFDTETHGDTLG
jgi:hypothetical protein